MRQWRLEASARSNVSAERTRRRRQAFGHLFEALLRRKCFVALAVHATSSITLRRVLTSFRTRTLRNGMKAWQWWLLQEQQRRQTLAPADASASSKHTARRNQPGKPRKGHCRCVYAVSRGQRCTCAPRSHLLRRVEELHRLVAQGLDGREGGYRLLSHVVQGTATPRGGARSNEQNAAQTLGSDSSSCNESWSAPSYGARASGGQDTDVKGSTRTRLHKLSKRVGKEGLPGAEDGGICTAATTKHVHISDVAATALNLHKGRSREGQFDTPDGITLSVAGGHRCASCQTAELSQCLKGLRAENNNVNT